MLKIIITTLLFVLSINAILAQKTITYKASDGLTITADLYEYSNEAPYMLLFHQANYSRGEYLETAQRFVKLGYNCLAVDLRSGNEVNFVRNQTATEAKNKKFNTSYLDAMHDIEASIDFVKNNKNANIVLVGSSYSASLCLLVAKQNKNVAAAIVFSPGEYFEKENYIRDQISDLSKPVFATSTYNEWAFMLELLKNVDPKKLTTFKPSKNNGKHGSSTLWKEVEGSNDLWLAVMMFVEEIKW